MEEEWSVPRQFLLLARYHAWANDRLLELLEGVSDEDYRGHSGLAFRSIHGTLNHILLGDQLWHWRLTNQDDAAATIAHYWRSEEGYATPASASNPWETYIVDRSELGRRIRQQSAVWIEFVEARSAASDYSAMATWRRTTGTPATGQIAPHLTHVFNHGTWHRGQISAAMTQRGYRPPELDMPLLWT